jgi:hypothetical protein
MFRRVQGVRTAGKSRDLLRFDDAEIVETDKPQPKSSFSTGCQGKHRQLFLQQPFSQQAVLPAVPKNSTALNRLKSFVSLHFRRTTPFASADFRIQLHNLSLKPDSQRR